MKEYIDRDALLKDICGNDPSHMEDYYFNAIANAPTADVVEVDKVAEMLRLMFDDDCACNYNGNDEWLPLVCEHEEECPTPKERLCCWKQFVKHFLAKMDGERKEQK